MKVFFHWGTSIRLVLQFACANSLQESFFREVNRLVKGVLQSCGISLREYHQNRDFSCSSFLILLLQTTICRNHVPLYRWSLVIYKRRSNWSRTKEERSLELYNSVILLPRSQRSLIALILLYELPSNSTNYTMKARYTNIVAGYMNIPNEMYENSWDIYI